MADEILMRILDLDKIQDADIDETTVFAVELPNQTFQMTLEQLNNFLPLATVDDKGVITLASDSEAVAGADAKKAITPKTGMVQIKSRISNDESGTSREYAISEYLASLIRKSVSDAKEIAENAVKRNGDTLTGDLYAKQGGSFNTKLVGSANAVGLLVKSKDNENVAQFGVFSPDGGNEYRAFIGWGSQPHSQLNSFSVSATVLTYKNQNIFHEGYLQSYIPAGNSPKYTDFDGKPAGLHSYTNSAGSSQYPGEYGGGICFLRGSGVQYQGWGIWGNNAEGMKKMFFTFVDSTGFTYSDRIYTAAFPPTAADVGMEHVGKVAIGTSIQGKAVDELLMEYYDFGSADPHDLVSFDPSKYETTINQSGWYTLRAWVARAPMSHIISVALRVNGVQYSHANVETANQDKRNLLLVHIPMKLNAGDKVQVYSNIESTHISGGSIEIRYDRPIQTTAKTKDIPKPNLKR